MEKMRRGLMALAVLSLTASAAAADAKFQQFMQDLWPVAKAQGLSRAQFDAAISGIETPDPAVLKLANNQPEFNSTTSQYLAKAVTPIRIDTGKAMKAENTALLTKIERKYGVDRHILLAIWGMESNFGKDLGSMGVIRSLATLRYSGRKADYARNQLPAAFTILKRGIRSPANFTGSWAAAMGHTQFIPTSYLSSAVDWTGDGKRDIWGSHEDALASTANYLRNAGWRDDVPWGWEITLPKGKAALIGRANKRSLAKWLELGVKPLAGKIPASDAEAFVMIPQGLDGPRFLVVHKNFMALWSYNQSHSYGIAVGHLADRIRGMGPIATPWPAKDYGLSLKERVEIQNRLQRLGFNPGSRDGRFGARTFEAILDYQKKAKLDLDALPSLALLEHLRRGL
jgi:membrane-bound lytic murein transglycosylase B